MLTILVLVPWVLTVGILAIIIMKRNNGDDGEEELPEGMDIVRVAVYEEKAYWVYDNVFYESDVIREPDFTTARPIDTMFLSSKQLNELLKILDEIENHNSERE
jgi:hypothetical protein